MSIQTLILMFIATFGAPPDGPKDKDDQPRIKVIGNQHFCCESVNSIGKGSGDGCVAVSADHINTCEDLLYCPFGYTKSGGGVTCTGQ